MRNKLIHNISSCTLTPAEERLLYRDWSFCVKQKLTEIEDFKTDIEINIMRLETHCHPSVFATICRHMHDYSNKFIKNIRDEEFAAIKSLKNNPNITISRVDKGNAIVILNKEDYIDKMNNILELK
ncbi:unnamed protein product [Adineta steineri]|uniref:Uncharacterized protein n=1 Tax=Adineta steineri TaxID=433720 RepID=A0A820JJ57_9BILA|nr:unnamed protein product [Adineta steineri]